MADDKQERIETLQDRVDELEATVSKMLPSRRDALKLGAAGAVGAVGMAGSASAQNSGQTGTIGTDADDWAAFIVNWSDIIPSDATGAVAYSVNDAGGDNLDVRLQNVTDGETVFEELGASSNTTGVVSYEPTTNNNVFLNWEIRSPDGSSQGADRPLAALGVQL